MTKQDLRTGMVVECRNGKVFQLLQGVYSKFDDNDVFVGVNCDTWHSIDTVNDDLTFIFGDEFDIMKVYWSGVYTDLTDPHKYKKWVHKWERTEPKELTVSEIEKLLGYPVKIVKE